MNLVELVLYAGAWCVLREFIHSDITRIVPVSTIEAALAVIEGGDAILGGVRAPAAVQPEQCEGVA